METFNPLPSATGLCAAMLWLGNGRIAGIFGSLLVPSGHTRRLADAP